jgi:hypothetical protein
VIVGASTNRKAVDGVVFLGFVIPLISFTSLSVEDYKVLVRKLATKYKKNVNIHFIMSENLPSAEKLCFYL